jgi:hypothetical protein
MSDDAAVLDQLPPEKLLDTSNYQVITPAIRMMDEVETVDQYLEHERANRVRAGILRELIERRNAIQEEHGENPPQQHSGESAPIPSGVGESREKQIDSPGDMDVPSRISREIHSQPSEDLLALVHEHGPGNTPESVTAPSWSEL